MKLGKSKEGVVSGLAIGTYALKRMAFSKNDAMKLAKMMLARGELCKSSSGMIGRFTRLSTQRQAGKHTPDMTSEAMVNGWDP